MREKTTYTGIFKRNEYFKKASTCTWAKGSYDMFQPVVYCAVHVHVLLVSCYTCTCVCELNVTVDCLYCVMVCLVNESPNWAISPFFPSFRVHSLASTNISLFLMLFVFPS